MAKSRRGLTLHEFNGKYKNFLEERFYGLAIDQREVIDYLDEQFETEIAKDENFQYSQIKTKFDLVRCYSTSEKNSEWEKQIKKLIG